MEAKEEKSGAALNSAAEAGYITRECRIIWAIATCNVMEEDGLAEETLWNAEVDVMAASE